MAKPSLLIIDDEASIRHSIRDIFEYENYEVGEAVDGLDGIDKIKNNKYDVVLLDIKMPEMDGMEVLEKIQIIQPDLPVVMISGHGNLETAVEAVRRGAYDYISKPPDLNRLLVTVRNAHEKATQVSTIQKLTKKVSGLKEIIGESQDILYVKELIDKVAPTDARVLVTGQNGTGKELVARWIHAKSNRSGSPLIEVNCAAIPSELIESELFGHEKGSFTSAHKQRLGKFELANGGTLFLDEIGDMSLSAQAKVLRALQEGKITRVGGDKEIDVDVRVIAATNKDLLKEIDRGEFRMDLYHRLSVVLISVPPLNQRRSDIPMLIDSFIESISSDSAMAVVPTFSPKALEALQSLDWTGNIRELRNVVERLMILCPKEVTLEDVHMHTSRGGQDAGLRTIFKSYNQFDSFQNDMVKRFLTYHLETYDWDTSKVAANLGLQEDDLKLKIKQHQLIK